MLHSFLKMLIISIGCENLLLNEKNEIAVYRVKYHTIFWFSQKHTFVHVRACTHTHAYMGLVKV